MRERMSPKAGSSIILLVVSTNLTVTLLKCRYSWTLVWEKKKPTTWTKRDLQLCVAWPNKWFDQPTQTLCSVGWHGLRGVKSSIPCLKVFVLKAVPQVLEIFRWASAWKYCWHQTPKKPGKKLTRNLFLTFQAKPRKAACYNWIGLMEVNGFWI